MMLCTFRHCMRQHCYFCRSHGTQHSRGIRDARAVRRCKCAATGAAAVHLTSLPPAVPVAAAAVVAAAAGCAAAGAAAGPLTSCLLLCLLPLLLLLLLLLAVLLLALPL